MTMFLLGMITMYIIVGISMLIYDIVKPGEIADLFLIVFGWWVIIPVYFAGIIFRKIKKIGLDK